MSQTQSTASDSYSRYLSSDYPVSVYYIDFSQMFMGNVRHHWHGEMEIDFVKSGNAVFKIGEETVTVNEGNAIIINANRIHSIIPSGDEKLIIVSVLFSPDYIFGSDESFVATKYREPVGNNYDFPYMLVLKDRYTHKTGIECINQILNDNLHKSYGYELITKSNLCKLWIWLLSIKDENAKKKSATLIIDEDRVKQGIMYIHEHYGENLTLETLADNVNLSKSECCRCFKRAADLTPFEYIMKHRIYVAAMKMQRGEKVTESINDLAVAVGFNNASYFNKVFKKYMDITPTRYREIIKLSHRDSLNPYGIPMT